MKALQNALDALAAMSGARSAASPLDPRIFLAGTLVFVGVVLSVPMLDPSRLVWMFVFPIVTSEMCGIGYARVFVKSLFVLPLVALIGIFNPILDHQTFWVVGGVEVSRGWVSFISIVLRALLSLQALLVLALSVGFHDMIKAMGRLGCPAALTTQLLMVYRYMGVLLQEALTMHRARESRGFGRRSYPLRQWGVFVGQLLVRSVHRARRIDAAMRARGFEGVFRWGAAQAAPSASSWLWLAVWLALFAALRFVNLTDIFNTFITNYLH